jgi:hypothetical protein
MLIRLMVRFLFRNLSGMILFLKGTDHEILMQDQKKSAAGQDRIRFKTGRIKAKEAF